MSKTLSQQPDSCFALSNGVCRCANPKVAVKDMWVLKHCLGCMYPELTMYIHTPKVNILGEHAATTRSVFGIP